MGNTHGRERVGVGRQGKASGKQHFDLEGGGDDALRDDYIVESSVPEPADEKTAPISIVQKKRGFFSVAQYSTVRQQVNAVFLPHEPVLFKRAEQNASAGADAGADGLLVPLSVPTSPDEMLCITVGYVRVYADNAGNVVLDTTSMHTEKSNSFVAVTDDTGDARATRANGSTHHTSAGEHEMVDRLPVPDAQMEHDARLGATLASAVVTPADASCDERGAQ